MKHERGDAVEILVSTLRTHVIDGQPPEISPQVIALARRFDFRKVIYSLIDSGIEQSMVGNLEAQERYKQLNRHLSGEGLKTDLYDEVWAEHHQTEGDL